MDFQEADRRHAELKRQLDDGAISAEEFDAQRQQLMVQDDEGRWWAKSRETGDWHYHDGSGWVRGTPPDYQPPTTLPVENAPDRRAQFDQGERSLQTARSDSGPVQHQDEPKQRRRVLPWLIIAAGLLGVTVLAGIGIVAATIGGGPPSERAASEEVASEEVASEDAAPDKAARPAPGYSLFEHDSRSLSVEVPSEWDERMVIDAEGEKGRASWSSFLNDGESVGPSMTAVNDIYSWRNGTEGHQGMYMVASKKLAQEYTDDELFASGPNDYSSSCEAGTPQDFDRPSYSGRIMVWENCGGDSDHMATVLAAAPEGRECVVVLQVGGYFRTQADKDKVQHVLDTFKVDCDRID
jgi:Short C-terminal domain